MKDRSRCFWTGSDELYIAYHDHEWGVPVHDDHTLFEMINLEGAQAGLSWITILRKRENYRKAFDKFSIPKILKYDAKKKAELMQNAGIVRNKLKINAVIENAKAYVATVKEFGTFDKYIWSFVDGKVIPSSQRKKGLAVSEVMSKDLKKRGFRFVGPTIVFAFMQAVGMMHDHMKDCYKFKK
jgi:DNA-3-methyladenine glycosylase I